MANSSLAYYKLNIPASILKRRLVIRACNRQAVYPVNRAVSAWSPHSVALRLIASALILLLAGVAQAQRPTAATHVVRPGETLGLIAQSYGIDLGELALANGIGNAHLIHSWQELTIPAGDERQSASVARDAHIVRRGETLDSIAADYGITLYELQAANSIWSWLIYAGQELTIPAGGNAEVTFDLAASPSDSQAPIEPSPTIEASGITHRVRFGETLGEIARDYGVSLFDLQTLNDIWTWTIYVGQELEIPAGGILLDAPEATASPDQIPESKEPSPPIEASGLTHRVRFGETLGEIARDYGVSLFDLQTLNDIWTWTIYVGQELEIPAGGILLDEPEATASPDQTPESNEPSPPIEASGHTHTVRFGETLGEIARDYGVSLFDLQALNNVSTWIIFVGQELAIPAGGTPPAATEILRETAPAAQAGASSTAVQKTAPARQTSTHTVKPGENLFRIAQRYGLSLDALIRANGITDVTRIHAGLVLRVSELETAAPAPEAPSQNLAAPAQPPINSADRERYTVQRGDSLSVIGARLNMSWRAIADVNGISNPNALHAGANLLLPTLEEMAKYSPDNSNAKNFYFSAPAHPGPRVGVGREIVVQLSTQTAYAYENGILQKRALISSGLPKTPTVQGDFKVRTKVRSQRMSGPGYDLDNVEWVMYFYAEYALHGTYWHYNFGQPMSHGCVNMTNADAKWFYDFASIGTPVHVRFY